MRFICSNNVSICACISRWVEGARACIMFLRREIAVWTAVCFPAGSGKCGCSLAQVLQDGRKAPVTQAWSGSAWVHGIACILENLAVSWPSTPKDAQEQATARAPLSFVHLRPTIAAFYWPNMAKTGQLYALTKQHIPEIKPQIDGWYNRHVLYVSMLWRRSHYISTVRGCNAMCAVTTYNCATTQQILHAELVRR